MMFKIWWSVIFLGLFVPSFGTHFGFDILMRMNKRALELVCQSQKGLIQDAMKAIQIPNFSSGSALSISFPSIIGIQIHKVDILNISVKLEPQNKIQLSIDASLHLQAKVLHDDLEFKLKTEVMTDVIVSKGSNSCPALSTSACKIDLGKLQVILSGVTLIPLELLQEHIHGILHDQLCLKVSNIFGLLNVQLGSFSALTMFSPETQVQYILSSTPVVTSEFIDLKTNILFSFLGKVLNLASGLAPLAWHPFQAQIIPSGPTLNLALSESVFRFMYTTLKKSGVFNCEITGRKVGDVNILTTAALGTMNPKINEKYPNSLPVILNIVVTEAPVVSLEDGKMLLHLSSSIEVLAVPINGDAESLMILQTDMLLNVTLKIAQGKLSSSVDLIRDITLALDMSAIGSVNVSDLQNLIVPLFTEAYLLHLNGVLSITMMLPHLFNLESHQPTISIQEGFAIVSFNLELHY